MLARDRGSGVARASERTGQRADKPTDDETFATLSAFILNAVWVIVAAALGWVIWSALWMPVLARQRRT